MFLYQKVYGRIFFLMVGKEKQHEPWKALLYSWNLLLEMPFFHKKTPRRAEWYGGDEED